jgi:PEGA domain-containing protein
MLLRRAFLIALVLCLAAPASSFAQGMDDMLAPLTSSKGKGKGKGKGKATTRTPKAPKTAKTAKGSKTGRGKGSKQLATPEPDAGEQQTPAAHGDDLLAPLVKKTELLVKLNAPVRGARLLLDDKDLGPIPKAGIEVTPGEHTVVVRRMGYRDFSRRVTAVEGESTEVGVLMEATVAFVSVKADVPNARVLINGEDKGVAPLDSVMLPPGTHDIVVQHEGFRPETQRIAVRAGKEYTVDVNLRPEAVASADEPRKANLTPTATQAPSPITQQTPSVSSDNTPLTKRWYFWAGVGAVVTAAAVGTVVATSSQPLDPNKVCGGTCDGVINRPTSGGLLQF